MGDVHLSDSKTIRDVLMSSYSDLVQKVNQQNDEIDAQTNMYQQQHSTDYKKSVYESESTAYLQIWYNYLFYIYYFIVLILFFYILMNGTLLETKHIIIIVVLFLFPFFIGPLEEVVLYIFSYVASFFAQDIYLIT
jgi:hypothetical protein